MQPLQQPPPVGLQLQPVAPVVERGDAPERGRVRRDLRTVPGRAGGVVALDRLRGDRTRSSSRPLRSSASTVLAKLDAAGSPAMAATSSSCSAMAWPKAGGKRSGRMRPKGGAPKGVAQLSSGGFSRV